MRAFLLKEIGKPLQLEEVDSPKPGDHEILLQVHACALCRTDLHIFDGELKEAKLPLILGHQVVGSVIAIGKKVRNSKVGMRMGIPWVYSTCGICDYCKMGKDNLCENALFTGYQKQGGLAEYCVIDAHFAYPIPHQYDDVHAAPLLCAGLIGYRAYKRVGKAKKIGLYGFGSSAHILTQIIVHQGGEVYAFTKKNDNRKQEFAKSVGAFWAGSIEESPPTLLDGAIIFAPSGELVVEALKIIRRGGIVVCAGIHMSPIPSFPYSLLWEERTITSVANLSHKEGEEFMTLASKMHIDTTVTIYPFEETNRALEDLRKGRVSGSIVIKINY